MPVRKASLHPPALDGDGDAQGHGGEEIPWVLLEDTAYVADRRNATTAYTHTRSGAQIQVTFCFARPPRVSYVCVYHHANASSEEEVIVWDPRVLSTDANLVLLSIALGPLPDLYIYRPAGDGGPSLTLLERPPCDRLFGTTQVGVLSWHTIRRDDNANDDSSGLPLLHLRAHRAREDTPYMVAALCYADFGLQPGHQLYVYDSKQPGSWRTHTVSVDEQHSQKHGGQQGHILHQNCKVIAVGGKHGTMGFVDLWRGIMLCDLLLVKDNPRLGYIKLPPPLLPDGFSEDDDQGDARLYRDIAVVEDRIMYVEHDFHLLEPDPTYWDQDHCFEDGWVAATWSRLITSPVDSPWEKHHQIDSSDMDITTPQFDLLPKVHDEQGKPFPPFKRLTTIHPTISLRAADATACFMVKKDINDAKAWVIAVDMTNNKLEAVFEFDAERSARMGFVYMHSGISRYVKGPSGTKGNRKRPGGTLLVGASNRKQPGILKLIEMSSGGSEEKQQDLEMEDMAEDGDNDMLLDVIPSE